MPSLRQHQGTSAEQQAAEFLLAKGFELIDRHVSSRYGEIDLLMRDGSTRLTAGGKTIVAVEVKARTSNSHGRAIESIGPSKMQKLSDAFHDILEQRGWSNQPYRIDVVTIEPSGVEHIESVG